MDFMKVSTPLHSVTRGHVRDTENVRELEKKHSVSLVGYDATWTMKKDVFRVYVREPLTRKWRGVYIMRAEDLEMYA